VTWPSRETVTDVVVGLLGLVLVCSATPISAAIGGVWGIVVSLPVLLFGLLLVALIQ